MDKMRILAVDDNPEVREFLVTRLSGPEVEVIPAEDGPSALRLAFEKPPDLILLDVMMPGITGFEVCQQLRNDPRTRSVPIIILTVKGAIEDRMQGMQSGADFYATKPIDFAWLFSKIRLFRGQYRKPLNEA